MKLQQMVSSYQHNVSSFQKIIDVLKFDVEGQEFEVLAKMMADGTLKRVKQICFEMHNFFCGKMSTTEMISRWKVLIRLENNGFQLWEPFPNSFGGFRHSKLGKQIATMINLHYINIRFLL